MPTTPNVSCRGARACRRASEDRGEKSSLSGGKASLIIAARTPAVPVSASNPQMGVSARVQRVRRILSYCPSRFGLYPRLI